MALMIRPSRGKYAIGKKIAFDILGTPPNLDHKDAFSMKAQKRLSYEETRRVR